MLPFLKKNKSTLEREKTDDDYFSLFKSFVGSMLVQSIFVLLLMSISRYFFYYTYAEKVKMQGFGFDLLKAFFLGIRFDFVVVSYINVLVLLLYFLLFIPIFKTLRRYVVRISAHLYGLSFLAIFFILVIDYYYYSYFLEHIDFMIFGFFEDDTIALLKTIWDNYPLLTIFSIFGILYYSIVSLFIYFHKYSSHSKFSLKIMLRLPLFVRNILWILLPLLFVALGARGSFGMFPLSLTHSVVSSNTFINKVAINGVVALHKTLKNRKKLRNESFSYLEKFNYKNNIKQAINDYYGSDFTNQKLHSKSGENSDIYSILKRTTGHKKYKTPPHVIVIVMESFGSYWLQFQSPEFNILGELEQHFDEDYLFPNFVSVTGATIGSITTLVTNLHTLPMKAYLSEGKYSKLPLRGATPRPFVEAGYRARFIYGGDVGWRNMYGYYMRQGFHSVEALHSIESKIENRDEPLSNAWGLYDHYVYDYVFSELQKSKKPQFFLVLTTTNHPPYDLPESYKPGSVIPPDALKQRLVGNKDLNDLRFKTFQYSNDSVGKLLTKIKDSSFKENTIVVITGDHGFRSVNFSKEEKWYQHIVPLYIYVPKHLKPKRGHDENVLGSHMDIMPTVYNLALSNVNYYSLGSDLFNPPKLNTASYMSVMYHADGVYYPNETIKNRHASWKNKHPGLVEFIPSSKGSNKNSKNNPGNGNREKVEKKFQALLGLTEEMLEAEYRASQKLVIIEKQK